MRKLGFTFLVALGLVFSAGISPASAQVPPSIVLDPSTLEVDGTFTVRLAGFVCPLGEGFEPVELRIDNDQQQAIFSKLFEIQDGVLAQPLTAPSNTGTYVVVAIFDNGECPEERATLTVVPRDTTPEPTAEETTTTTTTTAASTTTIAGQAATTAATTTAAPATLPATGRSTDGLAWIALAMSLLGGGLLTIAARRS